MAGTAREPRYLRPLRRAAETLLAILIIGAPVAIGGVHPQVMIAVACLGGFALLLVVAGRSEGVPISPAAWALAAGGLLSLATTIPLPFGLVKALSPHAAALSYLRPDGPPVWSRLSLDPPATLIDVARILGLSAIIIAVAALASRPERIRRLTQLMALASVVVVAVSAAHMLLGVTSLFGLVPQAFEGRSFTTFIDANHAASLAILSTLAALGLASARTGADGLTRFGWYVVAGIGVAMAISTQSVAGLAALALALGLYVVLSLRRQKRGGLIAGLMTIVLLLALLGGSVALLDATDLVQKAGASKLEPWPATLHLIHDFRWTGVGRGAFSSALEAYRPPRHENTITHPENFVLEWASTWGVPAAILGIAALLLAFWQAARRFGTAEDRLGSVHDALLAATVAVLVHDLADFGLEYAGVGVSFCVALGILASRSARPVRVRPLAIFLGVASIACAVVAARFALPRMLDAQLTEASFHTELTEGATAAGIDAAYRNVLHWHPADFLVPMRAIEALFRHAEAPVTPRETRESLTRAEPFLDRAAELTQDDWPAMSHAWLEARRGHRLEALRFVHEAYTRGHRWQEATHFALKLGATPAELSELPVPISGAASSETAESACALLGSIDQARVRRATADALLDRVHQGQLAGESRLQGCICTAFFQDVTCARAGDVDCDLPDDAPNVAAQAVRLGREWIDHDPTEARAYTCAAQAYFSIGAEEERVRVLATGDARVPDSPILKAALAEALVDSGKPADALNVLREVVPDGSDVGRLVRTDRVRALQSLGQHTKALREADEAMRLNPSVWWPYELAAVCAEQNGHFDRALEVLAQGSRFAPDNSRAMLDEWRARLDREKQQVALQPKAAPPG